MQAEAVLYLTDYYGVQHEYAFDAGIGLSVALEAARTVLRSCSGSTCALALHCTHVFGHLPLY